MIDKALAKKYPGGVVGVRARPTWSGPATFTHHGQPVRVVVCPSALAVREALRERSAVRWLVVITDRDDRDLGAGVLAHLVFQRLRTPDAWDAVCQAFHASAVDAALVGLEGSRLVAGGLLDAAPVGGWPPAPGGVLTRDHALSAVAHRYLLSTSTPETAAGVSSSVAGGSAGTSDMAEPDEVDATSIWTWTIRTDAARQIAELRGVAGDPLTAATLAWLAARTGAPERAVLRLLENGRVSDAVPLGLVLGLLAEASVPSGPGAGAGFSDAAGLEPPDSVGGADDGVRRIARDALVRLEVSLGGSPPSTPIGRAWATDARTVTVAILHAPAVRGQAVDLLDRADRLLAQIQGEPLAVMSDLLPSGLTARLERLAHALGAAVAHRPGDDPDQPLVAADGLEAVEKAWAAVDVHALACEDERVAAFRGGVRLVRSLSQPAGCGAGFVELLRRHRDQDSWVDAAFRAAARGVGETKLGNALQAVLVAARARRDLHDRSFAAALAQHTGDDARLVEPELLHIEDVLATHVLPLAGSTPVLLAVLDGMSLASAIEIVADVTGQPGRWQEAVPAESSRRAVAVAALPTDTQASRTSLLCGELRRGGQQAERDGLKDLARAHRLGDSAPLYHRGLLEETRLGMAVSDDVAAAIADVENRRLVSCVLNTIDDALDRADPGGTVWTVDAVQHLRPLLRQAWQAGRCVVLTSDHGHVVDRRDGTARSPEHVINARARAASQALHGGAADDEVYVAGRRVLVADGRVVLAVNERLRYVSRRAGYHGGAAPAEVVVPIITLVPGDVVPEVNGGPGLRLAPDQEPSWWKDPDPRQGSPGREAAAFGPRSSAFESALLPAYPLPEPPTSPFPPDMLPLFVGDDEGDTGPALRDSEELLARRPSSGNSHLSEITSSAADARPGVGQGTGEAGEENEGERIVERVLASKVLRSQERMTRGRGTPERTALRALLTALIDAPGNRLTQRQTATALGDHPLSVRRAVMSAIRLLNVEGYPVLSLDADGTTTVLDVGLLREQFDV